MHITNSTDLENAIATLQHKSKVQKEMLKENFDGLVESLKPANLLKSAVNNIAERPGLVNDAVGTTVAIGAGALAKKMIVRSSHNIFKRMLGGLIEFTVSRGVANNFDVIADRGLKMLKKMAK